jgi:alpha-D-ribose 1-methylphosphonate 5-phosphate C-P lyase
MDEVITDDRGGRMFVCSDTDHCETRRTEGHQGAGLPQLGAAKADWEAAE